MRMGSKGSGHGGLVTVNSPYSLSADSTRVRQQVKLEVVTTLSESIPWKY